MFTGSFYGVKSKGEKEIKGETTKTRKTEQKQDKRKDEETERGK